MADKRIEITQGLCRKVQLMMSGGAKANEIRNLLGISTATISRIKSADFDAVKYQQNSEKRRVVKKALAPEGVPMLQVPGEEDAELEECAAKLDAMANGAEGQVPGQVSMFEQEDSGDIKALVRGFMRLYAGKMDDIKKDIEKIHSTDDIGGSLVSILKEMRKTNELMGLMFNRMYDIEKVYNLVGQVLRKMDGGKR